MNSDYQTLKERLEESYRLHEQAERNKQRLFEYQRKKAALEYNLSLLDSHHR